MTLEQAFNRAMKDIYWRAKRECNYTPTRFAQMLAEVGGVQTARRLLTKGEASEGFWELCRLGRFDLTVEAHVLDEKYRPLFTEEERAIAAERLRAFGWNP